jgi:heptosyltransferase-2
MQTQQVLILSVAGIGNTVLQSPLINAVADREQYEVDVLFGDEGMRSVFKYDRRLRKTYVLPKSRAGQMKLVAELRRTRYDISIASFPSNRFEYNLVPYLIGARRRIIHSYRAARLRSLSFLSNAFIQVDENLHDVEQNMNLLAGLGIDPSKESKGLCFSISEWEEGFAAEFVESFDKRAIVGIHPSGTRFLPEKDWPVERFHESILRLRNSYNIILFGLPAELTPFANIDGIRFCDRSLNHAAALIKHCRLFISVDTGLMHVAAALGVRQLVLWGPTKFSRTRPWTNTAVFLGRTDLEILKYPFCDTEAKFHHPDPRSIMSQISVDEVVMAIQQLDI